MTPIRRNSRVSGLLGILALALGIVLLPASPHSLAAGQTPAASPSPSGSGSPSGTASPSPGKSGQPSRSKLPRPRHHRPPGTTVAGPRMWDPARNRDFGQRSTVTVSQTTNLVNQMVQVSWTGFTPSSQVLYDQTVTDYPVMIAECDTVHPRFWSQCYGANNGGVQGTFGQWGPQNTAYASSAANGTGEADIQILTKVQNFGLGCTSRHRCSLVIVPSQGGNTLETPANCSDHSIDTGGTDQGQYAFNSQTGICSWKKRIIVPLIFARAASNCLIKNPNMTALGSPMLARAMDQWVARLCAGSNPLTITYDSSLTEPEAIQDVPALGDIALTTRAGPAKSIGRQTFTYAPLAISAVAVAYWIDNPNTGKPVTNIRFDPRLIAKLVTQSYSFENEGCGSGPPPKGIGCDGAVDGNPFSMFADPEFRQLNRHVTAPTGNGGVFQVPTVMSGHSDMTWTITSWIAQNTDADTFLKGQFDPRGMHVNTDYLGYPWPTDSFTAQDSYPVIAHKYSPTYPLSSVASYQAQNWDPGTDWEKDQYGNFPRDSIEIPGQRGLIAILDEGDAAAFRFPVARLLNDKGKYVAPSLKSMAAAVPSLITDKVNKITQWVDFKKQSADAYPLTMVIYAMVPTSGISKAKADYIARFLDYVAGPGQHQGLLPGDLPPGYLPLTARMRRETLTAASEVLAQKGGLSPTTPPSTSTSPGSTSPSPGASPTGPLFPGVGVSTVAQKGGLTTGVAKYALPVLLITGGAATLAGTSTLFASAAGTIAGRLRRLRRVRLVKRRKP